jgi:signal transduction histidine kinase
MREEWRFNCSDPNRMSMHLHNRELSAIELSRFGLTASLISRSGLASIHLTVLLAFLLAQLVFSFSEGTPPPTAFVVALFGIGLRLAEMLFARRNPSLSHSAMRRLVVASILWTLALPLMLAVATNQPDTHYFGMLILPVLEAALYFSLSVTLFVAASASSLAVFWVAYAAHFTPPFRIGELLEATTLVLVLFVTGTLVNWLLTLLGSRDQELQRRLEDLELTRARLIEQEKLAAVGRLAGAVAHEIRNPVAIISSALEASGTAAISAREELSTIAMLEARRLERLTTDFLSYASPGPGPLSEVDVAALVGYIVAVVQPQAAQKSLGIDLESCDDCRIRANEGKLQQVLMNLMRNAIEASPEGGQISVRAGRDKANHIRIAIANAGPSIPRDVVPRIFEPFYSAKEGGTGLGLSIAQTIVEKHGGELFLEHNEPDRIVFAARLPALPEKHSRPLVSRQVERQWQES